MIIDFTNEEAEFIKSILIKVTVSIADPSAMATVAMTGSIINKLIPQQGEMQTNANKEESQGLKNESGS